MDLTEYTRYWEIAKPTMLSQVNLVRLAFDKYNTGFEFYAPCLRGDEEFKVCAVTL